MRKVLIGRLAIVFVGAGLAMASDAAYAAGPKGDPARGETVYEECSGCHSLTENVVGPRHCGVVGRKAGSVTDYPSYTSVMKGSGLTWNAAKLDEFLANPLSYLEGTAMGFAGLSDPGARADVIAYLEKAGKDPALCPK